jgi:hypothetical protein
MDRTDPNAPAPLGVPAPFVNPSQGTASRPSASGPSASEPSGSTMQRAVQEVETSAALDAALNPDSAVAPGDRRRSPRPDRRSGSQRRSSEGRRKVDLRAALMAQNTRVIGTVVAAIGTAIALYAYLHAPVVRTPSPACNEGFGGQMIDHYTLSLAWAPAVAASLGALLIPEKKRRPLLLLLLAGATIGLLIGAILNVNSEIVGFCLD